ncbi:RhoGAP-domain-containing protein [Calocera viscosa TUFC12733]|uniref:RhoGAP-domain-containing protein n=1 Tax=Calocera viscosa (strain TUFC12733) TaxID=1330018 RepID=A0A167ISB9_CALVF|nr:RhoGAP-domain-containing protein [Calocera viscosa TUFC12733]
MSISSPAPRSAGPSNPTTPSLPSTFQTPEHRRVLTSDSALSPSARQALLTPPPARGPSSSSPAGSLAHSPSGSKQLSLESVLALHAGAEEPALAALEQVLGERNTLAGQNAQLWKLIERQRVMQKSLERDAERLRGERDRALGRERDKDRERRREREREDTDRDEGKSDPERDGKRARGKSEERPAPAPVPPLHNPASKSSDDLPRPTASAPASIPSSAASRSLASLPSPTSTIPAPFARAPSPAGSDPPMLPPLALQAPIALSSSPLSSPSTPTRTGSVPAPSSVYAREPQRTGSVPVPSPVAASELPFPAPASAAVIPQPAPAPAQPPAPAPTPAPVPAPARDRSPSPLYPLAYTEAAPSQPIRAEPDPPAYTEQQQQQQLPPARPHSPKRGTTTINVNVVPPTPAPHAHHVQRASEQDPLPLPLPAVFRDQPTAGPMRRDASPSPGPLSPVSTRQAFLQQQQQQQQPAAQPYLTPADLPLTQILITHSTIRANDRGKDVLSFHIAVSPPPYATPSSRDPTPQQQQGSSSPSSSVSELGLGLGGLPAQRAPWAVEKLYSDILALDTKVRSGLGRTMQKKLGSFPEGKAFRDHAPVKSDQRKAALTAYVQQLLLFPLALDTRRDICAFFTTDVSRARAASGAVGGGVVREGYKEGYLTKRGKNFGGWKTRYFVLGGRVLEYYESRGGAHLGSIQLQAAKIGRQQRVPPMPSSTSSLTLTLTREQTSSVASTTNSNSIGSEMDDENAYRHAFLIIEQREGKAPVKHVLCAESDEERDSWVEHLVRYVGPSHPAILLGDEEGEPRASSESATRTRSRIMSKEDISISRMAQAVPISQLVPDAENAKLFRAAPPPPSPGPPGPLAAAPHITGYTGPESPRLLGVSASMPNALDTLQAMPRSNSSLGTYSDGSRGITAPVEQRVHSLGTAAAARLTSGQNLTPVKSREVGIPPSASQRTVTTSASSSTLLVDQGNDRDRKAKSGRFWNFGRNNDSKSASIGGPGQSGLGAIVSAHAVFGVTLQESLAVASIANLPAVVFRCIEYLEARGAEREEGIYRLSGSSAVVKALRERFNTEGDADLLKDEEYWDLHAVAGLLKGFLRELPTSVLTRELHLRFLAVIDLADPEERIAELASLIAALPLPNYSLLRALTAHLILIVQHSQENKMNMRNVGIVFSPTLGIPAGVFSLMLAEFNHVFSVGGEEEPDAEEEVVDDEVLEQVDAGEDVEYKPKRASGETGTPGSRNSRSYANGAADQLLGLSGRSLKPQVADLEEASDSDNMMQEESGTETEDPDLDGSSIHDSRSTSGQSNGTGDEHNSVPMPNSATQAVFDVNQTPTQAQPNGTGSKARMTANARGLQLAPPSSQTDMRPMGKVGLPLSPRPPPQMSPRP